MSSETQIENVSATALWVAYYRVKETERPNPAFRDPLARILVGERGQRLARSMPYARVTEWIMVLRTTAIDRLVEKAIAEGVNTVLNLGAGLDTRPYRLSLAKDLNWIEVDFKNIIDFKNEKLAKEKPVCNLERISMDLANRFERVKLFSRIGSEAKNVLVLTEGLIPYLTAEAAGILAKDLSHISNFKYWIQDFHDGRIAQKTPRSFQKKLKSTPFIFPWSLLVGVFKKKRREQFDARLGYVLLKPIKVR